MLIYHTWKHTCDLTYILFPFLCYVTNIIQQKVHKKLGEKLFKTEDIISRGFTTSEQYYSFLYIDLLTNEQFNKTLNHFKTC